MCVKVLISYIVIAGVTTIAATVSIYTKYSLRGSFTSWISAEQRKQAKLQVDLRDITEFPHWRRRAQLYEFSTCALRPLRDLQLFSGSCIIIAGLVQLDTISLYHLDLVCNYWLLTFNSLWAAQTLSPERQTPRSRIREWIYDRGNLIRSFTLVAVAIAIYVQSVYIMRLRDQWDPLAAGRCFRYADNSAWWSLWLWIAGLCCYEVAVMLSFTSVTEGWVDKISSNLSKGERRSISTCRTLLELLVSERKPPSRPGASALEKLLGVAKSTVSTLYNLARLVIAAMLQIIFWSTRLFLAIVAIGDGNLHLAMLFYIAFCGWSAGNAIQDKRLNRELVQSETRWGFGQVVPMVLLLSLGAVFVDAARATDEKTATWQAEFKQSQRKRRRTGGAGPTCNSCSMCSTCSGAPPSPPVLPGPISAKDRLSASQKYERPFFGLQLYHKAWRKSRLLI